MAKTKFSLEWTNLLDLFCYIHIITVYNGFLSSEFKSSPCYFLQKGD